MPKIRTQFFSEEKTVLPESNFKSSCFICAEHLPLRNDQKGESCVIEHSIRTIFRHLKITQIGQINKHDNQPVDVMPFCDRCYKIFTTLSSYCADLEVLQMRINYFLNKLNMLISVDGTTQGLSSIDIARNRLKTKLGEKCSSASQTGPFVVLPKLEMEQIRTAKFQSKDTNTACLADDDYVPEEDNETVETSDGQHDMECESDNSSSSKNVSRPKPSSCSSTSNCEGGKANSSNKTFSCLECGCEFRIKDSLLEHSPLFHPEKHFPPQPESNNLTQSQYKMYLTHLLNTEVDSCGSWNAGFNCVYCQMPFKSKRKHSVRLHLIKKHQYKLLKNLSQLQNDVLPEQIYSIVKMPATFVQKRENMGRETNLKLKQFCKSKKRMKPEYSCSICQVRTTSLRKHEALHHPEKFLFSKRLEQVSTEQFKLYCVYLINKQVENFTKSREDIKVRYHCIHCQNSYVDLQGCRNHLVLAHVGLLSVEIENLQQNVKPDELNVTRTIKRSKKEFVKPVKNLGQINSLSCQFCDVRLTQRGIAIHMRKNHPKEYLKIYKCEVCVVCKNTFRSKWWLDFHRTSVHLDKILGKFKAKNVSVEQFKSYCKHMIDTELGEVGQVGKTDEVVRYKCTHCSTTFGDMKYAQIHLVMKHKEILGNKLKELQENKSVVEIEQGVVTKKEEFEEGLVEDDDFEATDVFCVKNALKQEESESWDDDIGEILDSDAKIEIDVYQQDIEIKQKNCKMDVEAILPN